MKEAYRSLEGRVKKGYDIVFVARNTINDSKEQEVRKVMEKAMFAEGLLSSGRTDK